jgi:hypothetical protein
VRQAKDVSLTREDRLHVQMMRLKMTADSLRLLVQSVARENYVTTSADLEMMKNMHQEGESKDMGEIALALFYQLQPPGEQAEGGPGSDPEANVRRVMAKIRDIFGLSPEPEPEADVAPASSRLEEGQQVRSQDSDGVHRTPRIGDAGATEASVERTCSADPRLLDSNGGQTADLQDSSALLVPEAEEEGPPSDSTSAEGEARERVRQLLENILKRQVELCEAQRKAILKESLTGPSPYERAAEIAPTHPNARLMRRMQDSNFREVRRVTNLLLKIKRHQRRMEALAG